LLQRRDSGETRDGRDVMRTVYGVSASPFVRKVRVALAEEKRELQKSEESTIQVRAFVPVTDITRRIRR